MEHRHVSELEGVTSRAAPVEALSAVVPVLAEGRVLVDVVEGLIHHVGVRLREIRIIMSARAPAETARICADLEERFAAVHVSGQIRGPGLGWAVRQGIAESGGATHILLIDGDGEMDVATVPEMVRVAEDTGADLVIGSRWAPGGGAEGYALLKLVLNRSLHVLLRALYRTSLHDLTIGFKLGAASMLREIEWTGERHEIACETTLRPIRLGYHVVEVPTVWRRRVEGRSSYRFVWILRYVTMALRIWSGGGDRR